MASATFRSRMRTDMCASVLVAAMTAGLTVSLVGKTPAAQEAGARRGTGITSPEVASDRRVTFRLRAPEAKVVTVSC